MASFSARVSPFLAQGRRKRQEGELCSKQVLARGRLRRLVRVEPSSLSHSSPGLANLHEYTKKFLAGGVLELEPDPVFRGGVIIWQGCGDT